MSSTTTRLETLTVTIEISSSTLQKLQKAFKTVHYYPETHTPNPIPAEALLETEILFTRYLGIPAYVKEFSQVPKLRYVQLSSAGANRALEAEVMKSEEAKRQIKICGASGESVR